MSMEEGCSARARKLMPELTSLVLAFALAFALRGLPELRSAYPVGYDMPSLAFLITRVFDGKPLGLVGSTPLLYLVAWLLYRASGMEIFAFLKLFAPAIYGLLAASFYLFVRKAMGWGRRASLLCTAICILQVPTLRLSWDLLRNELGLVMLFLFLAATKVRSRWKSLLLAILSTLTVLSHELPAVLLFTWYGLVLLKHRREAIRLALPLLPAALLMAFRLAAHVRLMDPLPPFTMPREVIDLQPRPLENSPPRPLKNVFLDYRFLGASYPDLVVAFVKLMAWLYLPLALPALLGFRRSDVLDPLTAWICFATVSVLAIPFAYPFYAFHRWTFLLVFPFSIYATEGLLELRRRVRRWPLLVLAACLLAYGLVGVGYASGTFFRIYDRAVNGYVPWSLLESTVGVGQVPDCVACLRWLNEHAGENAVLVAERRFSDWALYFLDERIAIAVYPHGYKLENVPLKGLLKRFEEIYLVWYAGQDIEGFMELYRHGDIAIYLKL